MGILNKLFKKSAVESNNQEPDQKDSKNRSQESYIDDLERSIQEMNESEKEEMIDKLASDESVLTDPNIFEDDPLLMDAARLVVKHQQGSISLIQRTFSIGYSRSGRIIDQLEMIGIVGPFEGSKARDVNFTNILDLEKYMKYSLPHKDKMKLFYEKYKDIIEQRRLEYIKKQEIENDRLEKEEIKKQMIEKERKKRLHKEALQELIESGDIFNSYIDKNGKREAIPQDVMDKVWNRDGGRCVKCGSQENLEFDHIIPVSKGGATTYRNLQLLCKKCNLEKSNSIG
ncbi:MAG: HNH endonuclease [Bacteroidales bacterium]|nr:HNH endonuclease [Bacteroidales bacterium]